LVQITSEKMSCPKRHVGVSFYRNSLPDPVSEDEGTSTVLLKLETAFFAKMERLANGMKINPEIVKGVLAAQVDAIWEAFGRRYEVEAAPTSWNPDWTYIREAEIQEE
jgi:hypothetical protein